MNAKQQRFAEEYLVDLNATQAAIRAGYSQKTAYAQGQRLLKHVEVAEFIAAAQDERSKATGITAEKVMEKLAEIAFADPRKLFSSDNVVKPIAELDLETVTCIDGFEVRELAGDMPGTVTKVKLANRLKALELLGKHFGQFVDRVSHEGSTGNVVIVLPDNGRDGSISVAHEQPDG